MNSLAKVSWTDQPVAMRRRGRRLSQPSRIPVTSFTRSPITNLETRGSSGINSELRCCCVAMQLHCSKLMHGVPVSGSLTPGRPGTMNAKASSAASATHRCVPRVSMYRHSDTARPRAPTRVRDSARDAARMAWHWQLGWRRAGYLYQCVGMGMGMG